VHPLGVDLERPAEDILGSSPSSLAAPWPKVASGTMNSSKPASA
jgi:hypothetical protein